MQLTSKDMNEFARSISDWTWTADEDREMLTQYMRDREDLKYVYDLIANKEYTYAAKSAANLDTIVRDQIPVTIWNFLMEF
jgi:hypothetical protein